MKQSNDMHVMKSHSIKRETVELVVEMVIYSLLALFLALFFFI